MWYGLMYFDIWHPSLQQNIYMLVITNNFWFTSESEERNVVDFIQNNLFYGDRVPKYIIIYNEKPFYNILMECFVYYFSF